MVQATPANPLKHWNSQLTYHMVNAFISERATIISRFVSLSAEGIPIILVNTASECEPFHIIKFLQIMGIFSSCNSNACHSFPGVQCGSSIPYDIFPSYVPCSLDIRMQR